MSTKQKRPKEQDGGGAFSRFQKIARALFRVDKRDVPKHEPKRRSAPQTDSHRSP